MRSLLKILLGLAAVAVVLFVALVIAVIVIFEPEDYRRYIVQTVEDATGRAFELEGELGLDVFPCCAVALGPARLGNPEDFPDEPFVSVRAASLSLKVWPLILRREVNVGTVTLDGVEVALIQRADGRVNWELAGDTDEQAQEQEAGPGVAGLTVEAVRVGDARLSYLEEQSGMAYVVSELSLTTGGIDYGAGEVTSFPMEAAFLMTDAADGSHARVEVEAEISLEDERLTVRHPVLAIEAAGAAIPGGEAEAELQARALALLLAEPVEITVDTLAGDIRWLDARLSLTAHGRAGAEVGDMVGTFELAETSPRRLLEAFPDADYAPADAAALNRVAAAGRWSLAGSTVAVEGLDVRLDDTRLTGQAVAEEYGAGAVRFELGVDSVEVDRYLAAEDRGRESVPKGGDRGRETAPTGGVGGPTGGVGGPENPPAGALDLPAIDGRVRIGSLLASGVQLDDVVIGLEGDGEQVAVSLAAAGLGGRLAAEGRGVPAGQRMRFAGTLNVDGMSPRQLLEAQDALPETADPAVLGRLDGRAGWTVTASSAAFDDMRWRLDDTELTGSLGIDDFDTLATRFDLALDRMNVDRYLPQQSEAAPQDEAPTELPLEAIRELNLNGRLRAGELVVLDMTLRNVVAEVTAADGILRLDPLTASLYGGQYNGRIAVDATGAQANLTMEQNVAAVQLGEILKSLADSDVLAGSLSLSLDGRGAGNTHKDLLEGLAGSVKFDLSDGVYRGMDVLYELRRARALVKNEAAPEEPAARETPIRTLRASGRMVDGVLQTNQLTASAAGLELAGKGGIDLMNLALDYQLDARLPEAAAKAAGLGDLAGLTIPLAITGPAQSPSVGVNLKGLVTGALRTTIESRAREALLDRLGGTPEPAPSAEPGTEASAEPAETAPPAEREESDKEPSARDMLKRGLRDLLKPPPKPE